MTIQRTRVLARAALAVWMLAAVSCNGGGGAESTSGAGGASAPSGEVAAYDPEAPSAAVSGRAQQRRSERARETSGIHGCEYTTTAMLSWPPASSACFTSASAHSVALPPSPNNSAMR